jgi:hypothetical protein
MSLNITQDMCFETDRLESLQTMLLVAVQTMFRPRSGDEPVGDKQPLYLDRKAPSWWADGKDSGYGSQPAFLRRRFHQGVEKDKECHVLEPDGSFHGARMLRLSGPSLSAEEAAKVCCARRKELGPTRRWVATIRGEHYNEASHPAEDKIHCRGAEDAVAKAMVFLRQDENVSLKGIRNPYADGDGSYGLAYRMEGSGGGFCSAIHLSATWAYYGK